jgi:hypothetical protein
MKFFLFFVALLFYIRSTDAISAESIDIEIEFRNALFEIQVSAFDEAVDVTRKIHARGLSYYDVYKGMRTETESLLLSYGPDVYEAAQKLNDLANSITLSFVNVFNDNNLFAQIFGKVTAVRKKFARLLEAEFADLKAAVDEKPSALKCWSYNKNEILYGMKNTPSEGRIIADQELAVLKSDVRVIAKKIKKALRRLNKEIIRKCPKNPACVDKYVS